VNYALAFNTAVNLIVGLTLLLAWWRDRRQGFSRDLGWAYLTQAFVPVAFVLMRYPLALAQTLGTVAMVMLSALYLTLVMLGTTRLAGFAPTRRQNAAVFILLLVACALLLQIHPLLAQSVAKGTGQRGIAGGGSFVDVDLPADAAAVAAGSCRALKLGIIIGINLLHTAPPVFLYHSTPCRDLQ
jgi:hypothetical protein